MLDGEFGFTHACGIYAYGDASVLVAHGRTVLVGDDFRFQDGSIGGSYRDGARRGSLDFEINRTGVLCGVRIGLFINKRHLASIGFISWFARIGSWLVGGGVVVIGVNRRLGLVGVGAGIDRNRHRGLWIDGVDGHFGLGCRFGIFGGVDALEIVGWRFRLEIGHFFCIGRQILHRYDVLAIGGGIGNEEVGIGRFEGVDEIGVRASLPVVDPRCIGRGLRIATIAADRQCARNGGGRKDDLDGIAYFFAIHVKLDEALRCFAGGFGGRAVRLGVSPVDAGMQG